jgi:purine-nucleoside phosphorylase
MSWFERSRAAADDLRAHGFGTPDLAIVLGSGLGAYAQRIEVLAEVAYRDMPGFPTSSVAGHRGRLLFGRREGVNLLLMDGRVHAYEGYEPAEVVFPARVMWQLGARKLLLTNAAGGIRDGFAPGDLMLITDHLNLTGRNPLVGHNDERFGVRFADLTHAWDPALSALAQGVATSLGRPLHEGVYAGLLGPTYETPAEIRMLRTLGADAVGMSTVLEAIAWHHLGSHGPDRGRVAGISCITNIAAGLPGSVLSHDDVQEVANRSRERFCRVLDGIVAGVGGA